MQTSNSISKLAAALVKAQSEMKNPDFDAQNPHFKSKYASLVSVRKAVLPVLNKHGLALAQYPKTEDTRAGCVNVLMHESGEYQIEESLLPLDKMNAHGAGSCITYARRYSLQSIAGVVADEDDDANAAVHAPKNSAKAVTEDAFKSLPPAKQDVVRATAMEIVDALSNNRDWDAYALCESLDSDDLEAKLGLWSLLDSKQRARIKKQGETKKAVAA